jgi:repressor LexA
MKAIDRIYKYLEFKRIPPTRFEKTILLSNGYLATQLKRNADLGEGVFLKIVNNCLDINPNWLLTGKGEMLITENTDSIIEYTNQNKSILVTEPKANYTISNSIPFVDVAAISDFGASNFTVSALDVKDYYMVPKFNHKQIDFMIEVEGNSMYPKYNSGDVVACKIIRNSKFLQWNKIHVLATKEQGVIIKRLKEHTSQETLTLLSDNESYPPFHVSLDEITGIALVVGVISLE